MCVLMVPVTLFLLFAGTGESQLLVDTLFFHQPPEHCFSHTDCIWSHACFRFFFLSLQANLSSAEYVLLLVTEVHGRTFGVWTFLTCTLCFLCAYNLENKPLYLATFLSFIYAFGHFLTEYLVYHTMVITNLATVGIFAGTSIIWMLLQWNAHQPQAPKKIE
ncbi:ergosterol biosynthetic protein 28 isoform X1 [Telopea speciosissima]|uniref:ergosterol biosynthetic protein 28 isoform X1 n=1 Tax=Telopea speciosissima TaxID=54955 RepID=UPI001CC776A0|nr:ergosterol biosynthetic protein 28 isoform X1 [Telopea speciosissima]